jgi:hypothetical protein
MSNLPSRFNFWSEYGMGIIDFVIATFREQAAAIVDNTNPTELTWKHKTVWFTLGGGIDIDW